MPLTSTLPLLALAGFVGFALYTAQSRGRGAWRFPAILSAAFAVLSVAAIALEGPVGFWTEHTDSLWGNQVWIDLLLALGIGWTFLVPKARALGMRPLPWLGAVLLTGCIGLLAMLARALYLESHGTPALSTTAQAGA